MISYYEKPFIEVAKKFGIEDINFNYYHILDKLEEEYRNIPEYNNMTNNMIELQKSNDSKFISVYFDILEFLFTTDSINDSDKKSLLGMIYDCIERAYINMIPKENNSIIVIYDMFYKDENYVDILNSYIKKWQSGDNNYLKLLSVSIFLFNSHFCNQYFNNNIINLIKDSSIEDIAKSISEEYYKPVMVGIIKYFIKNQNNFRNYTFSNNKLENTINIIGERLRGLMFYNHKSSDIFDVLVRAYAYQLLRYNLYTVFKEELTNDIFVNEIEKDKHPTPDEILKMVFYTYIEENIFYECTLNGGNFVYKKLDTGEYIVQGYSIDYMGYEKEWFDNHPDCDCIYIDETPEFYETISANLFDMAFNSDPNLFDESMILYDNREDAKKAFMNRNNK